VSGRVIHARAYPVSQNSIGQLIFTLLMSWILNFVLSRRKFAFVSIIIAAIAYLWRRKAAIGAPVVDPKLPRLSGFVPILGHLLLPFDRFI
jgi:hypothetical protein